MKHNRKEYFRNDTLMEEAKQIFNEVITSNEEKQKLELRFRKWMEYHKTVRYDEHRAARWRELAMINAGSRNVTQNILAYAAIMAFFCMTGYVLTQGLMEMDKEASFIIGNLTGMAAAIAKDIYGYYFGSSKGESEAQFKTRRKIYSH